MFNIFKNKNPKNGLTYEEASEIVTKLGAQVSKGCNASEFIKSQASLSYPVFVVRESIVKAYSLEFATIDEGTKNAFAKVYRDLALYVDDDLYVRYSNSLRNIVNERILECVKLGLNDNLEFHYSMIASDTILYSSTKEIWENLARYKNSERKDLVIVYRTLCFCKSMHEMHWNEWSALTNMLMFKNRGYVDSVTQK